MTTINLEKHIWEGWRVIDFIEFLQPSINMIYSNNSWQKPFKDRQELKEWCINNQPYYKKYIPEVVDYFSEMHNIK